MRLTTRAITVAAVAIVLLFAAGCADYIVRDRVDNAGRRLSAHPGAVEAATYAEALHDAATAHAFADSPTEFRRRANEALATLTRNEATAGPDKPKLAALRGLLL